MNYHPKLPNPRSAGKLIKEKHEIRKRVMSRDKPAAANFGPYKFFIDWFAASYSPFLIALGVEFVHDLKAFLNAVRSE